MHAAVLHVKLMLMFCPHCRPSSVALFSLWVSKLHRYELMLNHCESPSVICSLTFLWSLRFYNEHEDFLSIWGVIIHRTGNTRTADAFNKPVYPNQSQWQYPIVISNITSEQYKTVTLLNFNSIHTQEPAVISCSFQQVDTQFRVDKC